jgi:hypothetical protein
MKNVWKEEPTAVVTIINAALNLAIAFGLHLSADQIAAIVAFTTLLSGIVIRTQVHSPSTVEALKEALTNPPSKFPDVH